ncbi:hypothetical protein FAZ19_15615 [Sphingobacterium alkalisoli]|uniref:GNAT family N-acetyltransferase n=1 Tax=Sphingobacterium alkalisoli TaxID=1874115 RepID=A0A4U0GX62_9SPHI|nr:hypothetical protein [Sphingobacterium alkalisoli]TJY63703.1 hypothetical protein FAZ19_15615 [Sphingobacterium alkalisoli]GGH25444.1 hypothetical protein GCM10011418_34050 [Sphingobacterium alkalisoli]
MALIFKDGRPVVRLRAFRAIDDPKTCERFIEGHAHVLTAIGVKKVTSSKNDWMYNPAAFVLIVESLDGDRVFGGVRIHVAGGSEPLPIEQATGSMDPDVYDLVYKYAKEGTGEGCGLWNSREIAGYGIGSIFLTRAGAAISTQIGINSLFALCAPYTVKLAESVGYRIDTSVGNNGTFYYPKIDLLATVMIMKNLDTLKEADQENKEAISSLRGNSNIVRIETLRNKEIEIHYQIDIPNLEQWDLHQIINNLKYNTPDNHTSDIRNLNIL